MSPLTRRDALHLVAAVPVGAAGCGEEPDPSSPPTTPPGPPEDRVSGYETLAVRYPGDGPFVRRADGNDDPTADEDANATADANATRDGDADDAVPTSILLTTREDADALRFADGGRASATDEGRANATDGASGTDRARGFLDATDFGVETLLVVQRSVGECHRLAVDYVSRPDGSLDVGLCSVVRDAAVDCDADERVVQATFVRLPVALDGPPDRTTVRVGSNCRTAPGTDGTTEGA